MSHPEHGDRHVDISDADERVVELDEPQASAPPTDEFDPEVTPVPPPDDVIEARGDESE